MYLGSKTRGQVGFGGCFSGSGINISGTSPSGFQHFWVFKVKFRISWHRGWFVFWFSGSGRVRGSNFGGRPPQVLGFWGPEYITMVSSGGIFSLSMQLGAVCDIGGWTWNKRQSRLGTFWRVASWWDHLFNYKSYLKTLRLLRNGKKVIMIFFEL